MADQRKVELILGIRTTGASDAVAGVDSVSKVAAQLGGNLTALQRADVLKDLGATAAQAAAQTGDLNAAVARLAAELTAAKTSEQDVRAVSKAFEQTTAAIEKAEAAQAKLNERIAQDADKARAAQERLGAQMAADIEKTRAAQERLGAAMAADIEKARASQEKLGAQMAADTEKALQAQAKKDERALRDAEKLRATQEKQGAAMASDIERSRLAAEKLGEKQAFVAAQTREAATGATTLQKSLGQMSRAEQIQKLGTEMGLLAKKTKDEAAAVAELNKQLKGLAESDDDIRAAASAFNSARNSPDDLSDGGLGTKLQKAGQFGRSLPSTPIPGTGISTDAVANLTRLSGVVVDLGEKSALATAATNVLTPALGAQTAATVGAAVPIIALTAGFAAVAIGVKLLSDELSRNVDAINTSAESQRALNEKIASGLTTSEAQKQLDELTEARKREQELLDKNKAAYAGFEKQSQEAAQSSTFLSGAIDGLKSSVGGLGTTAVDNGKLLTGVAQTLSGDEQALADQIAKSEKILQDGQADFDRLTTAIQDGSLAANDAAEAEKKLADERSKSALNAADVAARELQAEQRALNATEDGNKKRLDSIEDEKAVIQEQIDVLTESGVTSEEVTAKLASLNSQLGSLGKESDFIKETALEVSRQADAEKKAAEDQKKAQESAERAQLQYTKAIDSAGKQLTQSVQDISTRFRQTVADNQLKFDRDLTKIATKYREDEFDLNLKAFRAERDAALDQKSDLKKIREDANKEEQQAQRDGDFRALYEARVARDEALKQEQNTLDEGKQKRDQAAQDAQDDLLRNARRQREARVVGFKEQEFDNRTARDRDLVQARLAQQRATQAAGEALNAELGLRQQFWNASLQMAQQAVQQINGLGIAAGQTTGANRPAPQAMKFTARAISGVIRR